MLLLHFVLCSSKVYKYKSFEKRSLIGMCSKYSELFVNRRTKNVFANCFTKGENECDIGVHSEDDILDTVDAMNFYRYLTGIDPVVRSKETKVIEEQMKGAKMMSANNILNHVGWTTDHKCYSDDAARATRSSNIAMGYGCTANTIKGYIDDTGTSSLGHRLWLLFPPINTLAIGIDGSYSAIRVFDFEQNGKTTADFIAFPPPGPIPYNLIPRDWSFTRKFNRSAKNSDNCMPSDSVASITCNGEAVSFTQTIMNSIYPNYPGIIKMTLNNVPKLGEECKVVIKSESENSEWRYKVTPINCTQIDEYVYGTGLKSNTAVVAGTTVGCVLIFVMFTIGLIVLPAIKKGGKQEKKDDEA